MTDAARPPISFAGIIAGGKGRRLRGEEGTPKPLVMVAGRPLCHWAASSLRAAGARTIFILLNSRSRVARDGLRARFPDIRWIFLEADTDSSWESFRLVAKVLAGEAREFVMSTVDTLLDPREAERFAVEAAASPCSGALALSAPGHDARPFWARLGESRRIASFGEEPPSPEPRLATAGLYYLRRELVSAMPPPFAFGALREFWHALSKAGTPLLGVPIRSSLDVDEPEDLARANALLKGGAWA
jgi:glucose-1-phosphate thymidylyltransferase